MGMLFGRVMVLVFGLWACSTSVIFIKESTVHPVVLAGYRLLFAALFLLPLYGASLRRWGSGLNRSRLRRTLLPAVFLAVHLASWNHGARMTHAVNATILVNLLPLATPFLLWLVVGERVNRGEIAGTVIALTGVLALTAGDFRVSRDLFTGDLVCLGSMILFAAYLVFGRKNRDFPDIWLYVVPLYAFAGLLCFLMAIPVTNIFARYPAKEYLLILGLVLFPTIAGHSIFNYCLKYIRGQVVSVVNLTQFIFAGIMAYLLFDEIPELQFYAATAAILVGAVVTIRAMPAHELPDGPTPRSRTPPKD